VGDACRRRAQERRTSTRAKRRKPEVQNAINAAIGVTASGTPGAGGSRPDLCRSDELQLFSAEARFVIPRSRVWTSGFDTRLLNDVSRA